MGAPSARPGAFVNHRRFRMDSRLEVEMSKESCIYRQVLSRGILLVRCNCHIHDKDPYRGNLGTVLDVLSLATIGQRQVLVSYHFEVSVTDHNHDHKFSMVTNSDFELFLFHAEDREKELMPTITTTLGKWPEWSSVWWGQGLGCSITFDSGTEFADVSPSHPMILPTLVSAHADFVARFSEQTDTMVRTGGLLFTGNLVEAALDSLLKRYSALVAQAVKEQTKHLYGVK